MKKYFALLLAVLCVLYTVGAGFAAYYDEGHAGTENDPYIIDSAEDLKLFRDRMISDDAWEEKRNPYYYRLDSDIDITSETNWTPIGDRFQGHFDGNGHTITVSIDRRDPAGLFGIIDKRATVKKTQRSRKCYS